MDIKEVYQRKQKLEQRIYNMIRKFENDCNVIVSSIMFFNNGEPCTNTEYDSAIINTALWNDKYKVE